MQKCFDVSVNAFSHGRLVRNPRAVFTLYYPDGKVYPMRYGDMEVSYAHFDWLHLQIAGSIAKQFSAASPIVKIEVEYYDKDGKYHKDIYTGKPDNWQKV